MKMKNLKIKPSVGRIFKMDYNVLIGHFALITLKRSNLSALQRNTIISRVEYLLLKGKITQEDIDTRFRLINVLQNDR